MRDYVHLLGIGDHDPIHVGRQHFSDGRGIAGRLDHHMIIMGEFPPGELLKPIAQHLNAAELDDLAIKQRHDLGGYAVYVHADIRTVPSMVGHEQGASGQHDKYISALAAHPGES
ncbi:hypothetical protein [Mesorhizobium sp. LNJC405B00]|uniref:hypothetical protein n=1 Tax=Mesorhizobium sp. LNJC405B00 TaxID=1287281 RepID=UPI0032AFF408